MAALASFVTWIHIALCFIITLVVLVQQGKGAEISASFGGSSQTVFGSSGGATFFTRFTWACAIIFAGTSLFLATMGGSKLMHKSIMDNAAPAAAQTVPLTAPAAKK